MDFQSVLLAVDSGGEDHLKISAGVLNLRSKRAGGGGTGDVGEHSLKVVTHVCSRSALIRGVASVG